MILGIYGYQDAGKTKLFEELVRALVGKGYRVSSVKHTPHRKSVDSRGKDTWRHWKAGSDPVVFSSEIETTLIRHSSMSAEKIVDIINSVFEPDVIIVEGFKEGSFPKVAIGNVKPRKGTVLINPKMSRLVRYVETEVAVERALKNLPGLDCGKCGLDCVEFARAIARGKKKIKDCKELPKTKVEVCVGRKKLPMGRFASSIVDETLRGMLGSLKCYAPGKEVEIRLEAKSRSSRKR